MDNINSRCNSVTKEYKQKYDKLLSLVNGYEIANNNQNESMKSLADIISNTKELISESEFETLKKEQKNIMEDFAKLENMKNDPYSNDSLNFTSVNDEQENSTQNEVESKPKRRYMEELIEEEEEETSKKNESKPKRKFMEETIEEEEETSKKKNESKPKKRYTEESIEEEEETSKQNRKDIPENLKSKIRNNFSLDSLNNIKNKSNNENNNNNNNSKRNINARQKSNTINYEGNSNNVTANKQNTVYNRINQSKYFTNNSNENINSSNENRSSINANKLISNNREIIKNYFDSNSKNYDVYSNYQDGNIHPQMPTIQIVNVQEAPKENNQKKNKKQNLKENLDTLLEKSTSDYKDPIQQRINLKKNVNKFLEESVNDENILENKKESQNFNRSRKLQKKNYKPIAKKSKTKIEYFKDFINDYTESIVVSKQKKSHKNLIRPKKKCKNSKFVSKFENKTGNHNIFK